MARNDLIKTKREALGLTMIDAATAVGLNVSSYEDTECYEDEIFTVVTLSHVRKILFLLKTDYHEIFDIPCLDRGNPLVMRYGSLPLNRVVERQREFLGIERVDFADLIGFHVEAVVKMEEETDFFESWPLELIKRTATHLQLPIQIFLNYYCPE